MGADHRILSLGYNGVAPGEPGCLSAGACPRGKFTYEQIGPGLGNSGHSVPCIALHAERNCMEHFKRNRPSWRRDLVDATLYLTHESCRECRKYIEEHPPLNRIIFPAGIWIPHGL